MPNSTKAALRVAGLLAALLASAVVTGCSSPSTRGGSALGGGQSTASAAANSLRASDQALADTLAASSGPSDPISQAVNYVAGLLPLDHDASPAAQRARMQEQAGTAHFRHEELAAGREEMSRHRAEFAEQKVGFVSPAFSAGRQRLQTGRSTPFAGPVLGAALPRTLANPDLARTILTGVAATEGVPVVTVNPILAQLLPAFGN